MEAHQQPGECGAVDGLEFIEDEIVLGAALPEINFCGELDEEDGSIGKGVPASQKCVSHNFCGELDEEDGSIGKGVPASQKCVRHYKLLYIAIYYLH